MSCLSGKIDRIGKGLQGDVARLGSSLSCGITLACGIGSAIIERIGDGLTATVSRIDGLKADIGLVCSVNDNYSCFGHGFWSNDDDWHNGDDWRNDDIVED